MSDPDFYFAFLKIFFPFLALFVSQHVGLGHPRLLRRAGEPPEGTDSSASRRRPPRCHAGVGSHEGERCDEPLTAVLVSEAVLLTHGADVMLAAP